MKRRARVPKAKGVVRIDDPGRHGVGWYARVTFRGKTHSKYFADAAHGGTKAAFTKAVTWRDTTEKQLGKPRTDRVVTALSTRSPTGIPGVYQSRESFVVAYSPVPGELRREFISIKEFGREEALRRAIELRRKRERTAYGKSVSRHEDARSRRAPAKRAPAPARKRR